MAKDISTFEKLFYKYRPGLVAFAGSIIQNSDDAEEIVHDVFLAIWNQGEQRQIEEAGMKSYLFTSVKNRCLNHIRKSKLDYSDLTDDLPTPDQSPGVVAQMEAKEAEAKVHFLIDQLPTKCKQIFIMSRLYELSHKEIAEVLELSPKTIENQVSIALKYLKDHLSRTTS